MFIVGSFVGGGGSYERGTPVVIMFGVSSVMVRVQSVEFGIRGLGFTTPTPLGPP